MKLPPLPHRYEDLPSDPKARHEACMAIVGHDVFSIRNRTLRGVEKMCENAEARVDLANLWRQTFDDAAKLAPADRQVAYRLAREVLDRFLMRLFWSLGNGGNDHRLGDTHAMRYRLDLEFLDIDSEEIVHCETVNRGGVRYFGDYWGRWLNSFGDLNAPKDDSQDA